MSKRFRCADFGIFEQNKLKINLKILEKEWLDYIQRKITWKELLLPSLKEKTESLDFSLFLKRPIDKNALEYCAWDVFEIFGKYLFHLIEKFYQKQMISYSKKYITMFSDLTKRTYDIYEANEVMPLFIFISDVNQRVCKFCHLTVPLKTFTKKSKRRYMSLEIQKAREDLRKKIW